VAIGAVWFPGVDRSTYEAVREKVFPGATQKGLQFHAAGDADGRWCIVEVWQSRDGLERFIREDLARAFDETGAELGEPPQPDHVFEVAFQGP
jgi:quinol monooxygenase YgiN